MARLELYSKQRSTLYLDFLKGGPEQRPKGQQALALECCPLGKETVASNEGGGSKGLQLTGLVCL